MKTSRIVATCSLLLAGCHADTLFPNDCACGRPATLGHATLQFATQPNNAYPGESMTPPVQVAVVDAAGHRMTSFTGLVHIAIDRDASLLHNARLSGATDVAAVAGVATFTDLRIDQLGFGYTLRAGSANASASGPSAAFDVSLLK